MDYRCRLGLLGNSSTAAGHSDPCSTCRSELQLGRLDFFFFVPALLLSILTPLFSHSSVSLSYFILAVPMREFFVKHSCMNFTFSITMPFLRILRTPEAQFIATKLTILPMK